MNKTFHIAIALTSLAITAQATAQVTFYESSDFRGRTFTTAQPVRDFSQFGFNDRASSAVVSGNRSDRWEVCEDGQFRGRCVTLRPGQYPSLSAMGLNDRVSSTRVVDRNERVEADRYAPVPPPAQTQPGGVLRERTLPGPHVHDGAAGAQLQAHDFNDRASSAVVRGNPWDRWEVCEDGNFRGRCVVLRPGQYPSLSAMGLNDRVSSTRVVDRGAQVDDDRYAPLPMVSRDYGRRRMNGCTKPRSLRCAPWLRSRASAAGSSKSR